MKNCMWIQSENLGGCDYYFSDGCFVQEGKQSTLSKAVKKLIEMQGLKECNSRKNKKYRHLTSYPNFTLVYSIFKGFLYKSQFNEIAKSGRQRGFAYWCKFTDIDNMWSVLTKCAAQFEYTIKETDKPIVEQYIKSIKRKRIILLPSIIIIIIFIAVWILMN